jgi:hypothetical protein
MEKYSFIISFILLINLLSCQRIPEYLSIKASTGKSRELVYEYMSRGFEGLIDEFDDDDSEVEENFFDIFIRKINFAEPDSWHTTCLYIGKNYSQLNSTIYKEFIPNVEVPLEAYSMIYIPEKIITAPVFFNNFTLIDNKYPHITVMLGSYAAVDSNYVLRAIIEQNENMRLIYESGMLRDPDVEFKFAIDNLNITFDSSQREPEIVERTYIIKMKKPLQLDGVTTYNY